VSSPRSWSCDDSDAGLVAATRAGRQTAFEALFARHWGPLLGFCTKMLGSAADAEDVLQEVFVAAHAAILADDREIVVRPWLHRIARNRCLNHLRRRVVEGRESMDFHPDGDGITTAELVHDREELRAILGDLDELPETQRAVLVLRQLGGLSYAEIAAMTGATVPAVRSRLVRARLTLATRRTVRSAAGALAPAGAPLEWLRARLAGIVGRGGPAGGSGVHAIVEAKLAAIVAGVALLGAGGLVVQQGGSDAFDRPPDRGPARAAGATAPVSPAPAGRARSFALSARPGSPAIGPGAGKPGRAPVEDPAADAPGVTAPVPAERAPARRTGSEPEARHRDVPPAQPRRPRASGDGDEGRRGEGEEAPPSVRPAAAGDEAGAGEIPADSRLDSTDPVGG